MGIPLPDPPLEQRIEADLLAASKQAGIRALSTRADLEEAHRGARAPLYYEVDWHLTPDGNRVVSESVGRFLAPSLP